MNDENYVAPFVDAQQCDHEGVGFCTRCCLCNECGLIRFREVEAGEHA